MAYYKYPIPTLKDKIIKYVGLGFAILFCGLFVVFISVILIAALITSIKMSLR